MATTLVTISSPNHQHKLIDGLRNLFLTKSHVDYNFTWGCQSIGAHRLLLDMFLSTDKLQQTAAAVQRNQGGDSNLLESLLEFLYTGRATLARERLDSLLVLAKNSDFSLLVEALQFNKRNYDSPSRSKKTSATGTCTEEKKKSGNDNYPDLKPCYIALKRLPKQMVRQRQTQHSTVVLQHKKDHHDNFSNARLAEVNSDLIGSESRSGRRICSRVCRTCTTCSYARPSSTRNSKAIDTSGDKETDFTANKSDNCSHNIFDVDMPNATNETITNCDSIDVETDLPPSKSANASSNGFNDNARVNSTNETKPTDDCGEIQAVLTVSKSNNAGDYYFEFSTLNSVSDTVNDESDKVEAVSTANKINNGDNIDFDATRLISTVETESNDESVNMNTFLTASENRDSAYNNFDDTQLIATNKKANNESVDAEMDLTASGSDDGGSNDLDNASLNSTSEKTNNESVDAEVDLTDNGSDNDGEKDFVAGPALESEDIPDDAKRKIVQKILKIPKRQPAMELADRGVYKCSDCDLVFNIQKNLWRHQNTDGSVSDSKCIRCGEVFSSSCAFERHMKDKHLITVSKSNNAGDYYFEFATLNSVSDAVNDESDKVEAVSTANKSKNGDNIDFDDARLISTVETESNDESVNMNTFLTASENRDSSYNNSDDTQLIATNEKANNESVDAEMDLTASGSDDGGNKDLDDASLNSTSGNANNESVDAEVDLTDSGSYDDDDKDFVAGPDVKRKKVKKKLKIPKRQPTKKLADRRVYKCSDCDSVFHIQKNLWRHQNTEGSVSDSKCRLCEEVFSSSCAFERHTKDKHLGTVLYNCQHCDEKFQNFSRLYQHSRVAHSNITFDCTECPTIRRFKSLESLKCHHSNYHEKRLPVLCDLCPKRFASRRDCIRHKDSHEHPVQCQVCPKYCNSKQALKLHVQIYHEGLEKNYKCDQCPKAFHAMERLKRHKFLVHSGLKPFVCEICGKACREKGALQNHQRVHSTEKIFKCQKCSKDFRHSHQLRLHLAGYHNETKHQCSICGKCYSKHSALMLHLRSHSNQTPFVCECGESFVHKSSLVKHRKDHHNSADVVKLKSVPKSGPATNVRSSIGTKSSHKYITVVPELDPDGAASASTSASVIPPADQPNSSQIPPDYDPWMPLTNSDLDFIRQQIIKNKIHPSMNANNL